MTTIPVDPQTHRISATATVSEQGTVAFLGTDWYCLGAQPGWEVSLETMPNFGAWQTAVHPATHSHIAANQPEVTWTTTISQDFNLYDTRADIAERLQDGFFDQLFNSTLADIEGHAFRLSPITNESNNTL